MTKHLSTLVLAATAALTAATGAQAFQGEQSPLPPAPFKSTLSRAEVQAQAQRPVQISNGSTGVHQLRNGKTDRSAARASAVDIAPEGAAAYGEAAGMRL